MTILEVGMYIRTKDGVITRITDNQDNVIIKTDDYTTHLRSEAIKSSYDLSELIEVGDYVNGEKVTPTMINIISMIKMRDEETIFGVPDVYNMFVKEIKIKTVVTKEQFKNVSYRVGE